MLEHQKKVLQGVSYDKGLFRKELVKSQAWLNSEEFDDLRKWVKQEFSHIHQDIIDEVLYEEYNWAS